MRLLAFVEVVRGTVDYITTERALSNKFSYFTAHNCFDFFIMLITLDGRGFFYFFILSS